MFKNKIQKLIATTLILSILTADFSFSASAFNQVAIPKSNIPTSKVPPAHLANSKAEPVSVKSMTSEIKKFLDLNSDNKKNSLTKAQNSAYSGTCGNNVTWDFQPSTGKLTVSGFGEMFSYANTESTPWFSLKSSITSLEIEDGITSIGSQSFGHCDNLESVTIPDSVTNIQIGAFVVNENLVSVTFGKNIRRIGRGAFWGCAKLESVSLPNSLVSIGLFAFGSCSNLKSLTFGNRLKIIGQNAFSDCVSLTSITIPSSVTSINAWAFVGCSNLETVVLKASNNVLSYLGEGAFAYTKLRSFTYFSKMDVGNYYDKQFDYTNLESVTVPSNYEGTSFYGKSIVKSANLLYWDGGENIGCILDTISNTLTVSGSGQMYEYDEFPWDSYKSTIKTLVIEEGVTSISEGAFKGFSEITSVVIPNSVKYIGKSAFEQCNKLSSVTLGDNVNTIGQNAFSNCNLLNVLNIPKSVSFIEDAAFSGCNNIHKVTYLGSSDPGKTSSNVFSSPYLSYVDVPSNYNSNRFCGKSVRKDQPPVSDSSSSKHPTPVSDSSSSKHPTPVSDSSSSKHPTPVSDSSSSKHPKTTSSSDICNCDKSEDYFDENKSWIIPLIVTAVIDTLGVAAAVVGVVYKIFCNKPNDNNGVSL